jgi:hypothetical protein
MNTNLSKMLLALIIGALEALQKQSITLNEAEQLVFSPAIVELSKLHAVDIRIIELLHSGTELEDILSLTPDSYATSIAEIEKTAHALLKALPEYEYNREKLIKKLF